MKLKALCAAVVATAIYISTATLAAFGAGVTGDDAKGAVTGWVRLREALGDEIDAEPESVATYQGQNGKGEFHVVSLKGGGYVITSGDTEITPILGYSKTGTFDADENSPMWALLTADVAARAAALEGASGQATGGRRLSSSGGSSSGSNAQDTDSPASAWSRLMAAGQSGGKRLQAKISSTPTDLRVASFVQSKWSQSTATSGNGYSHNYYNYYTPNKYPCGCVATAQAQTMRYFEWPKTSVAAKTFTCQVSGVETNITIQGGTYDWAHMPYVPREVAYDWNNVIGIAKLTSDVGISLCMSYKSGGSGTSSLYVGDSLVSMFGYSNAIADYEGGGVKGNTFKKNVIPSLDAKLPVVLGIQGRPTGSVTADAGHSILTDGYGYYNNQLYIHLNFGWSGSDDAWYTPADSDTGAIINASDYNFTNITCTVFNIFTNATQYSVIASGRVLDQNGAAISGATVTAKYNNTTYATATSDARGVYALILPPTSSTRTYTVNAAHSEYTSAGALSVMASQTKGDYPVKSGNNYSGGYYIAASNSNSYDNDITMESLGLPKLATPESPTATEFGTSASVTLTCATNGATIYYTLDGSTPTTSSTLYSGPIALTKTTMVKARAFKSGYASSDVFTRTFVSAAAIDEYYFRHDFSGGTQSFIAGEGTSLTRDQVSGVDSTNAKAVNGPDGPGTAFHPGNSWGPFEQPAVLHGAWSAAMSLCMDATENGALVSFGRLNTTDQKEIALLSSSSKTNFYFKVMTTDSSGNKSVENTFTVVTTNDLTRGFHTIVVAYTPASEVLNGIGSFDIYCNGVLVRTVSTDTPKLLGANVGGMQYCLLMSAGDSLAALGAVSSQTNDEVAFYDFRFYDRAFTASEAAKYAAAYPRTVPGLEDIYFRYDFSDGTRQFIGSASQASDPLTADAGAANFVAAYGQDGSNTAVHVKSNAYGTDKIGGSSAAGKAVLAGDWTLAMSVRPGSVEKGLLFSLGRANDNNSKCVFLASSSTAGKIYVGTARKKGSANSYTGSVDRELAQEWGLTGASADTTSGYHSIVAVHSSGGMVAVYVDGELAGSVDTTENASGCVFGNGIQFNQAHGSSTFLSANGYSQSLNNPDVAFQDVRFYNFAFTAETAAAYAALYPATLPGFSNLDQYAYVQSYGVNGVDTGVYMTDTDKFTADFAFTDVSYKSWLCGAGKNANKQTHAIYLNGNQQLAWTTRGEWWWSTWPSAKIEGSTIEDTRLVMTVESSLTANLTYYDTRETKSSDASSKTATSTGPSIIPTHLFRANSMVEEAGQECKAKIYSFEVDADSSTITPRAFFAPTTDANGAAGFTNVVAGTFHGECLSSPSTALTFTSGVGRAEDYRYRSGKFYSRIYARSADSTTGLVKFDGGEAAGTNAQYTARGRTAKIVAVPAEYYAIDRWEGDTWAIADGSSATDAAIAVQSDTAIQLRAVFKYVRVSTPALGEGFTALFNGSATFALSCATEGASIYYTTNGTTPTASSTLYEGTFSFNPESLFTTLKAIAVKDGWYDSDVFEVKLVNLAVAPKSAYAQAGSENLLLHLDAIENAGAGTHSDSLATWADLAGNHTVTETGSAGFQADAWIANGSSCFLTTSTAAKDALAAKAFTLELVISHPSTQNQYENWVFIGENNSHRQLSVDMRSNNSQNPLIQGVQYRESSWNGTRSTVPNKNGTATKWNTRQYIAVVCDANGATAYYDGMNVLHTTAGGGVDPTTTEVSIGASFNGGNMLYNGSEICAVRMTSRALTEDERMRNFYVDSQRFGLEGAPAGYCIANGNVKVRITEGVEGFEFSTDGGSTWTTGEVWVDINTAVTLSARVAASTDQTVKFKNLPEGATTSGNSATFTPTKPCAITVSAAQWTNNDGTGSFDNVANWIGGVPPAADDDFTVNISGDTVITVNETYSLGIMTVKGTGSVTFTGIGSISATTLNVASNLTVDTCGKLTVTGVAGAGNVILTPASDTLAISSASTLTGDLTIKADSSVAFNVNAATSVSNFYVRAATNAVVTLTVSGGSFISTETIVKSGVLKQGSATALGNTPKVTVENGGTFDVNGLAPSRSTTFCIAGAGAGDWPWALTSSVNVSDDKKSIDIVNLADDATIGGNVQICIGVRGGATFNATTQTLPLTLNGHTLTKTGTGTLWFRRPYSTNEGTIDVQSGTLRVNGWSNANAAYGQSCVSNIALVVHEGATAKNELSYVLYFKTLDLCGGALTSSSGAFGMSTGETLSGHGTAAKLTMANGAVATLDGDLSVTTTLTADGALSLVRKTGVETNVTVAVTGTLTASGAITVGAGVIFDIGVNRPTVTLTVDDDATIVLRRATDVERNVVLNVTANPQNIVVYDTDGTTEIADPPVTYDSDAGTVTIRVFIPRWTNNDGTGSFDNTANWASGVLPLADEDIIVNISSDTVIAATNTYNLGDMTVKGTGSATFTGDGSISATMLSVASNLTVDTSGKLTVPGFAGAGNVVLTPASGTLAISAASTLTGDLTVKTDSSVAFNVNAATSVRKFYVNAVTNAVVTLTVGSGGSFKATSEAIVQHGVLKQGGNNVLGTTPKISVENGGTFDINGKTIRQETPIYIAGAGAGDWPWALATSSGMASGNYLYNLYLNADSTIGAGQFKFGQDNVASKIKLNGHTLTAKSWMTFRNINTDSGTIDLQQGNGTGISLNQYANLNTGSGYRGTTLILRSDTELRVQNRGTYNFAVVDTLKWYGGTLTTDPNNTDRGFGVREVLEGYGTTKYLKFLDGARFKPDGMHYLTVTEKLEGTMIIDLGDIDRATAKERIPLFKVGTADMLPAPEALQFVGGIPKGWELKTAKEGYGYVLVRRQFMVIVR